MVPSVKGIGKEGKKRTPLLGEGLSCFQWKRQEKQCRDGGDAEHSLSEAQSREVPVGLTFPAEGPPEQKACAGVSSLLGQQQGQS